MHHFGKMFAQFTIIATTFNFAIVKAITGFVLNFVTGALNNQA
jgi:hypothetical protein